jgi:hypothetical protein
MVVFEVLEDCVWFLQLVKMRDFWMLKNFGLLKM